MCLEFRFRNLGYLSLSCYCFNENNIHISISYHMVYIDEILAIVCYHLSFLYCNCIFIYSWQIVTVSGFVSVSFKISLKNCSATDWEVQPRERT